jgi:catechol 2,3-dioxygenase-like lactoylglutathione lyase family enzyme
VRVLNIRWVGVATDEYEAMRRFAEDVLGLRVGFEEPATVEYVTADGDTFQLFASAERQCPVPLFEIDDVHAALEELEAAGVELDGGLQRDSAWEWVRVRAPDGNRYELASRLRR